MTPSQPAFSEASATSSKADPIQPILPGATLGLLGGGQLGRMFALEAKRMGYRVVVLEPAADSPCGQLADRVIAKPYVDPEGLAQLAQAASAITYEFENVDAAAVEFLEKTGKPIRPGSQALKKTQDRWLEKSFLTDQGLPVAPFGLATSSQDLDLTLQSAALPGFLKTSRGGYDGKGQVAVATVEQAEKARQGFGGAALIYEQKVDFILELSVVACRNHLGEQVAFPVLENHHRSNILDYTVIPGRIPALAAARAREIAFSIGKGLDFVGTFCVEMFLTASGEVVVNEIAPRPHNSGHFSLDACSISQFELQVRALCGLPLVEPQLLLPSIMLNLIGDGRGDNLLGVEKALALPGVHLHLYGKSTAPLGRKMGHITVMADTVQQAWDKVGEVRGFLHWG